eukprot:1146096-Pelagomonas_calceolata.AAC.1
MALLSLPQPWPPTDLFSAKHVPSAPFPTVQQTVAQAASNALVHAAARIRAPTGAEVTQFPNQMGLSSHADQHKRMERPVFNCDAFKKMFSGELD